MALNDDTLIALGLVLKPRGLSGELSVKPYRSDNTSLHAGLPVTIKTKTQTLNTKIVSVKNVGARYWLKFENITDRNIAQMHAGGEIFCRYDQLPQTDTNEYFVFDLIGLQVVDKHGTKLGKVTDVISLSANDLLVVDYDSREILLPFLKNVIKNIDKEQGIIEIDQIDEYITDEN